MVRVAASLVFALALAGCADPYGWGLDPDAAHIVPNAGPGAPRVITQAPPDSLTPGVEGSILFVRLIDSEGDIVLDRAFDWPSDEQPVSPGDYTLSAYWRVCNGNCGTLSGESDPLCEEDVTLRDHNRVLMEIVPSDLLPGDRCTISIADS